MLGLADVRRDLWAVLDGAPAEVPALRAALVAGEVDGRCYYGHCACLIGTIANARGCDPDELERNPDRPAEDWFFPIRPDDDPWRSDEGSCRAATAARWIDEWTRARA
jgi:hypothetical protein